MTSLRQSSSVKLGTMKRLHLPVYQYHNNKTGAKSGLVTEVGCVSEAAVDLSRSVIVLVNTRASSGG
jgi:hypothetical protein